MIRIFSHYIPRNTLLIAGLEIIILGLLLAVPMFAWTAHASVPGVDRVSVAAAAFALVIVMTMSAMGLYAQPGVEGWRGMLIKLPIALIVGTAVFVPLFALYSDTSPVLSVPLAGALALAFMAIAVERSLVLRYSRFTWLRPRVLVLGTGSRAAVIEQLTRHGPAGSSFDLVGFLPVKEVSHSAPARLMLDREHGESLLDLAKRHNATEIVVAVRDRRGGGIPVDELLDCKLFGIKVTQLSSFFEQHVGQVRLDSLNASWLIFGEGFRQNWFRTMAKRLFDIVVSGSLLIATLPVLLVTALAILITMGRPVFYKQQRVGQGGKVFWMRKFRSMRADAEGDGMARWAQADDDRVTPVGRVIRKLRIDELPQVLNVFRGEMSFVGPRPERPEFVDDLKQQIPFYDSRHSIKPGITGWAQVRYPYGASIEDARQKLQYDLYYVKNHTLFLDLMILLDTFQVILFGKGAR